MDEITHKKIKVLWFSNTPAAADESIGNFGTGGWLKSLDKVIQNDVELYVAFEDKLRKTSFKYNNTNYYPIYKPVSFFYKLLRKIWNQPDDEEDLDKYLTIIHEIKPDIIHIHGTERPFSCLIKHTDIPCVVSIQGNITVCAHKYFAGIEKEYLNKRKINSVFSILRSQSKYTYTSFKKYRFIEEKNMRIIKNIIGRTGWDRRITSILSPKSTYYYCSEILRESFYTAEWKLQNQRDKIIIHTTNSNVFYKGFETLCLALMELNKINQFEIEWRVAGISVNDSINYVVKRKLGNKYPRKGLVLMGNLNEEQLVNGLLDADMYVMTSHIENSPNNLCEAMILGMPCIATFAGGTGSLMQDNYNGIFIQDGDPWAMAGAIKELIDNKEKAELLGRNARFVALSRHDKTIIKNDLLNIYRQIRENN